jgi:hypothetical protein
LKLPPPPCAVLLVNDLSIKITLVIFHSYVSLPKGVSYNPLKSWEILYELGDFNGKSSMLVLTKKILGDSP